MYLMNLAEHNSLLCYNSNALSLDNFSLQKAVLFWFLWRLSLSNQISFYFIFHQKITLHSLKSLWFWIYLVRANVAVLFLLLVQQRDHTVTKKRNDG